MNAKQHVPFGLVICFIAYFYLLYAEIMQIYAINVANTWVAVILFGVSGACFPDTDIPLFGIENHRNFLWHSAFFPALMFWGYMYQGFGIAITGMFCIGYSSHLILDLFPSNQSVKFFFTKKFWRSVWLMDSPGAIKPGWIVPFHKDGLYITINAILCLVITLAAYIIEYKWLLSP